MSLNPTICRPNLCEWPAELLQANGIAPLNKNKKRNTPEPPIEHVKREHQGVIDLDDDEEKAQRIKALEVSVAMSIWL